ncbi:MAG TPA: LysM peptidoglycan-binding domain-containing protein [Holophagaceae bacterium]|nr:LysM peptidoglycan-binding domain-containing protein [Holophagaceae bacterium]
MAISRLASLICWGAAAAAPQAPPASPPKAPVPAVQAPATAQLPAPKPPPTEAERVARLRELVEAAEKALDGEDEDAASDRADEAEVLVADWDQALLERPDVQILLERLKGVQTQVDGDGDEEAPAGSPPAPDAGGGLKEGGQVTILKGSDLSTEVAKVQAAEAGASYDFPIDLNDKVLTWVRLFTTDKRGYIERTLARGSAYFPMIRQVFAEEGIPQDLAYLGVVESGYLNQAKSYARAVGMWQFMPSTGRLFGLKINRWVDERRDPVKATRAAARYLRRLYETSGDWYLALVGYNAGPLTAQKAQQNLGTANFWDMYRSPYLRNQTKNYVPELCAAILIAHHPDRYGFQAPPETPFTYETVEVRTMTSLKVIARCAGVPEADIKALNPQLLRGSTPPGDYDVRVPVGTALEAQRKLSGVGPKDRHGFRSYRLRRGDTLERVARRFKVDPQDLLDANRVPASAFRPGRSVLIPPPGEAPQVPLHPRSAPSEAPAPGEGSARPLEPLPALPADAPGGEAAAQGTYRAQPGDTLARIARAKGLSLGDLIRLNPEAAKRLQVGDLVRLPGPGSEVPPPPAADPGARPRVHVVRSGETLSTIAERYHLSVRELQRWNGLRSTRLRAGQRLRLSPR